MPENSDDGQVNQLRRAGDWIDANFNKSIHPGLFGQLSGKTQRQQHYEWRGYMAERKTGWPFQEGFLNDGTHEIHLFTDYRWNDGSVSRRWHVDPDGVEFRSVETRPFSLESTKQTDQ